MNFKYLSITLLLGLSPIMAQDTPPALNLSVVDFGAVPDGTTVNTAAIQKAIDTCSEKGGGSVTIPAGRFVTGTLQLKDGVTLSLAAQSFLIGSPNGDDYQNLDPFKSGSDGNEQMGYALIIGKDAKNVGLEGPGVVDGQGAALKKAEGHYDRRPFLVRWVRCTGVSVHNVTLTNSGAWTMNLFQSQNVVVNHVIIKSVGLGNNDGIDTDSSHHVQISDCDIDSGDDSICFKATSPLACHDIQVDGCTIHSGEAGIKFGTESMGNFENITISNCHILKARGGIKLYSVDGSQVHNIQISGVKMENTNLPIMVRLGARRKVFRPGDTQLPIGDIDGVLIKDIEVKKCSNIGILVSGIPGHPVKNLVLQNITLQLPGNGSRQDGNAILEEKEAAYPEINMFGNKVPASGAFMRHVQGVKVSGFTLSLSRPDLRPTLFFQDAQNVDLKDMTFPVDRGAAEAVRLDSCQHVSIQDLKLPPGIDFTHQVVQSNCSDVSVQSK
jgi:polygalacturonase